MKRNCTRLYVFFLFLLVPLVNASCGDDGEGAADAVLYHLAQGSTLIYSPSLLSRDLPRIQPVSGSFLATPVAPLPVHTSLAYRLASFSIQSPGFAVTADDGGLEVSTFRPHRLGANIVATIDAQTVNLHGLNPYEADANPPTLTALQLCALAPDELPRPMTCDEIKEGGAGGYILYLYAIPTE